MQRDHILSPKTSALAALIKKGDCAPPAPSEFMAFHKPGARKPTPPIMHALNRVLRYHTRFSACFAVSEDAEIEVCSAMLGGLEGTLNQATGGS